jgi:hypothetical protein
MTYSALVSIADWTQITDAAQKGNTDNSEGDALNMREVAAMALTISLGKVSRFNLAWGRAWTSVDLRRLAEFVGGMIPISFYLALRNRDGMMNTMKTMKTGTILLCLCEE